MRVKSNKLYVPVSTFAETNTTSENRKKESLFGQLFSNNKKKHRNMFFNKEAEK